MYFLCRYETFTQKVGFEFCPRWDSNPTEGKIRFSQVTLFYRVKCEKLFCKTNIKLKVLKLNKTKNMFDCWKIF